MEVSTHKVMAHSDYPTWIGRSNCAHCGIFRDVLFSSLTTEDLVPIIEGIYEPIDEFCYKPGAVLYQEGGEDNAIYTLRSGLVKLVRYRADNGGERIIRLLKTADSTGLERLLDKPYGHTAIAIREVHACRIPVAMLQKLDEEKPRFYRQLMERWATGLFQADDYIMLLMTGSAHDRVAHLIKWLGMVTTNKRTNRLELLSGKDMAAMLDLSIESISRIIADLKRRKILRYTDKGGYYEYDPESLDKYAALHQRKNGAE